MKAKISYVISALAICLLTSCAITGNTTDPLLEAGYLKPIEPVSVKAMGAGAIIDPKDMAIVAAPWANFSEKEIVRSFSTAGPMETIYIETLRDWAEKKSAVGFTEQYKKYAVVFQVISNNGQVTYYRICPIQKLLLK